MMHWKQEGIRNELDVFLYECYITPGYVIKISDCVNNSVAIDDQFPQGTAL